jgi:hypothetical protein
MMNRKMNIAFGLLISSLVLGGCMANTSADPESEVLGIAEGAAAESNKGAAACTITSNAYGESSSSFPFGVILNLALAEDDMTAFEGRLLVNPKNLVDRIEIRDEDGSLGSFQVGRASMSSMYEVEGTISKTLAALISEVDERKLRVRVYNSIGMSSEGPAVGGLENCPQ